MSKLMKKFLEFSLGSVAVAFLGLLSSPIITRLISTEEYGKASMFNTLTSLFLLILTLGLDQAYVRFFHEEDGKSRGKLLRLAIKYPLLLNIIFSLVLLLLYKPISIFIIGKPSISVIFFLIVANTLLIINRFNLIYIRMEQKGKFYSFLQICGKLGYLFAVFVSYIFLRDSYLVIIIATIFSTFIISFFAIYLNTKKVFKVSKTKKQLNTSIKEMIIFGAPLILSTAIIWIFQSIDKISIKFLSDLSQVGIYSSAFSLVALLNIVQGSFSTFFVPVANEHYKNNPNSKKFFTRMNKLVCLIMFSGAGFILLFKDLIVYFLGSDYREARFIFPFLLFTPIMYAISETTVVGISFKKRTNYNIIIALLAAISNIILNIILIPKFGVRGAAISTGVAYIVFFVMRTYFSKKLYKVNYNIPQFIICTIFLSSTALYATFNDFDFILLILGLLTIISAFILYDGVKTIKKNIFKMK